MNKFAAGVVLVGVTGLTAAAYMVKRVIDRRAEKQGRKSTHSSTKSLEATKSMPSSEREQLLSVSVVKEPVTVTDTIYSQYQKLYSFVIDGETDELLAAKRQFQRAELKSQGRLAFRKLDRDNIFKFPGDGVIEKAIIEPELLIGEKMVSESKSPVTCIYVIVDEGDAKAIIVQREDMLFSLGMRDDNTFVASGPALDTISTMGYLELLLSCLMEELGLE